MIGTRASYTYTTSPDGILKRCNTFRNFQGVFRYILLVTFPVRGITISGLSIQCIFEVGFRVGYMAPPDVGSLRKKIVGRCTSYRIKYCVPRRRNLVKVLNLTWVG